MKSLPIAIASALILLTSGCAEDPPAPIASKAPPPQKVAASKPAPQPVPAAGEPEAGKSVTSAYEAAGSRDPFEPLLVVKKQVMQSDLPLTPLQTFELSQLRLVGVIIGKGVPKAMVTAPDGKAYILQKGILVGKNNGRVHAVQRDAVLVEEQYFDFTGEVRTSVQEIRLPKREGVL